jgi:flagellar biosynthesis protein FlhG
MVAIMNNQLDRLRIMVKTLKNKAEQRIDGQENNTRVITIASGKGGVGKSNFTINLALALSELGKKVLVLDADLGLANLDLLLGISPSYNLYHVIHQHKEITDIIFEGPRGVKVIPGGSGIHELADLKEWELERFLTKLAVIEQQFDFLLIDTGAGISKNVLNFTLAADDIYVITTPEPTSLADAYGLIKTLNRYRFPGSIKIVINRVYSKKEGEIAASKLKVVANRFLTKCQLDIVGSMPEDRRIGEAVKKQEPFLLAYPNSEVTESIYRIAASLSNQEFKPKNNSLKEYFSKMFQSFRD